MVADALSRTRVHKKARNDVYTKDVLHKLLDRLLQFNAASIHESDYEVIRIRRNEYNVDSKFLDQHSSPSKPYITKECNVIHRKEIACS